MSAVAVHAGWPALDIALRPIAELLPYIRNPRAHSEEQISQLAASMREFGWVNPVLVDEEGTILAGHGRILAARRIGWLEAPVMVARGWSEAKRRAYVIADNKLTLNASWDVALLDAEIQALRDDEFAIGLLGFSEEELARLADDAQELQFERSAQPDPNATPGAQLEAGVALAPDQVAFTVPVTVAERSLIFEAVEHSKMVYHINQSGVALWQICKRYLELK
jgi:ParB-like chromosome segregation protein Spo0J